MLGARESWELRRLPPRVALFQWRARRLARRLDDHFSPTSATRPADLAILLDVAAGRRRVVELGTATAWTALSLALADEKRRVTTFDPVEYWTTQRYLELVSPGVRERLTLVSAPGSRGPSSDEPVDLLYIDSAHGYTDTVAELRAWSPVLTPGALVVFDDYANPDYPDVRRVIAELRLDGTPRGTLFAHEVPQS